MPKILKNSNRIGHKPEPDSSQDINTLERFGSILHGCSIVSWLDRVTRTATRFKLAEAIDLRGAIQWTVVV